MTDIIQAITGLLGHSWRFLMHTFVPGTEISFGVLLIGLALVPIGFGFLCLAMGHSVGEMPGIPDPIRGFDWRVHPRLTSRGSSDASRRYRISDGREHDIL